jgi:bifunctional DNA-binding transcriptional regulator/antitoxin component of YhaV-PrlF toxin-antitoxin module
MSYANISVEPAKMSTRGQIVIPQVVRERVKIGKDALFMVGALDDETIILKKVDRQKMVSELLSIRKKILQSTGGLTSKEIEAEIHAYRTGK